MFSAFLHIMYLRTTTGKCVHLNAVKVRGEMRLSRHCQNWSRDEHAQLKLGLENKKEKTIDL